MAINGIHHSETRLRRSRARRLRFAKQESRGRACSGDEPGATSQRHGVLVHADRQRRRVGSTLNGRCSDSASSRTDHGLLGALRARPELGARRVRSAWKSQGFAKDRWMGASSATPCSATHSAARELKSATSDSSTKRAASRDGRADGVGGAFAAVLKGSFSSPRVALTALDLHADGTAGPVSPIATGTLGSVETSPTGTGHAPLSWATGTHSVRAAMLGPASARLLPWSLGLPGDPGDYSFAVDPRGAGIIALARGLRPTASEPIPMWRLISRLISGELPVSRSYAAGTSLGQPAQVAIDDQGRALILWIGPRATRAPVEVLLTPGAIRPVPGSTSTPAPGLPFRPA